MGIIENLRTGVSNLKDKVEEFKTKHTTISLAVSEIINSLPKPFDAFGRILWDGLEQKDESAENVLITLQKMAKNKELAFMEITTNIKKLMDSNPNKDDILQVSKQIRESEKSIIDILGTKIDNLSKQVKTGFEETKVNTSEIKNDTFEIKADVSEMKQLLIRLTEKSKAEFTKRGIESEIKPDQKIEIPPEFLKQIEERNEEIQRLSRELEKVNQTPQIDVDYLIKEGNFYFHKKSYDMAIGFYNSILKNEPKNIHALRNTGLALDHLGRHEEAIRYYDRALDEAPKYVHLIRNKAIALDHLGRHEEADKWFGKAVDEDLAKFSNHIQE